MQKFRIGQSVENECQWTAQPQMGFVYHIPSIHVSETIVEEEMEIL